MAIPVGTAVGYLTLDYSDFSKNLGTAINEASSFSGKMSDTLGQGLKTIGNSISSVGRTLTTGVTLPLATAGGAAIKFGAEFDKQMSSVQAVTGATTEDFGKMRDAAIEWGGKTVYTATEAGQALYYMGLAGWDANKSVAGLGPVLNLAAAGNLALDRTSDIVTDAMTAMGLEAGKLTKGIENTTHFTNVMAQTMSNSNTDVDQLGQAFKYVAPLAGSLGYSIDDLGLALGLMANVGVKASQAGTGLRQALKSVIAPTSAAQAAMDKYGVSLYDSEGKAKSLRQFMKELRGTFKNLGVDIHDANGEVMEGEQIMEAYGKVLPTTQQEKLNDLVTIFGVRALPGVLGIIEQSDEKFNDLANAIDGADTAFNGLGAAAGQANTQMDNLWGDWIKFTSALGTAKIAISDIVKGELRVFVQKLTELVTKFNNLDKAQQEHILKIVALIAAIGPLLFVFGKVISGIGTLITAFNTLKKAFDLVRVGSIMLNASITDVVIPAISSIGGPILAVVAVIGVLIAAFTNLWKNNEKFKSKMTSIWNEIKAAFAEAGQAIVDLLNELGFDFEDFKQVVQAAIAGMKTAWNAFCQFIAPVFRVAWSAIAGIIKGIVGVFTGVIQTITGIIHGINTGDWSGVFEGMKKVAQSFFTFMTAGLKEIPGAVYEMIASVVNYYGGDWASTWSGAKQKVSDFVKSVGNWFKQIPTEISKGLNDARIKIGEWARDIAEKAKDAGKNFVDNVQNFFNDLPYKVGYILGLVITNIALWVVQTIENAKQAGREFVNNVITFMQELPGKIQTIFTTVSTNINTFKTNAITRAKELGNQFVQSIINFIKNLPSKIEAQFNSVKTKVDNFKTSMINKAKNIGENFKEKLMNAVKDIPNKMKTVGTQIVNGVWQGIQNAKSTFVSNINRFFSGIVDGAKAALGIKSPSRVMADEVGKWLPPGLAEGFEKAMPKAVGDIQSSLDDGINKIDTDDSDLSISVNGFADEFMNTVNTVTIWFESIEERLSNVIDSMRQDIYDMINLGNVLTTPEGLLYNYRTGMLGGDNNIQTNQNQGILDLLNHIIAILDNPQEPDDNGGDIIIPVYIGNEELDTMVVRASNRNDYRSGGR